MCIHEFYLSTACRHHFPKLPPSAEPNKFFKNDDQTIAVPQDLKCTPVKLALKFYHDQVVYLPADMHCGEKVELPRKCPVVHSLDNGPTEETIRGDQEAKDLLNNEMMRNGLGPWQQRQIVIEAAKLDQCSKRTPSGEHNVKALRRHLEQPYPPNMFAHVQNVRKFQERDRMHMMPNVQYFNVDFGCGGPFSPKCLTGWSGRGLLTHRLHHWSDHHIHPYRCDQQCLTGWSGNHLDTYRQKTWLGRKAWDRGNVTRKPAPRHALSHHAYWVKIDYSNIMDLHTEQWDWDSTRKEFVRKENPPYAAEVVVPEQVSVPVSQRLHRALSELCCMSVPQSPLPEEVERASIEDILGRLPEAFEEQDPLSRQISHTSGCLAGGYESTSTLVDEPAVEPAPVEEETPEMAEARRRKAREVMREKLKRDFSKGKGKMVDEEGKKQPTSWKHNNTRLRLKL